MGRAGGLGGGGGQEARASGLGSASLQIDRFIPVTKLKYYFAVDTMYVGKKLGLLFFPYLHQVSTAPTEGNRVRGGGTPLGVEGWGTGFAPGAGSALGVLLAPLTLPAGLGSAVPAGHSRGPPL